MHGRRRPPLPSSGPEPSGSSSSLQRLREIQARIVEDQLGSEFQKKQSLEQRGITIITSSSAIATLIFAVSAFVTKSANTANFVRSEAWPIKLSIIAFLGAAILGLGANVPFRYGSLGAGSLLANYEMLRTAAQSKINSIQPDPENAPKPAKSNIQGMAPDSVEPDIALQDMLIAARSEILRRTQKLNFYKSEILLGGFVFEIVGIGLLVWAVFAITAHVL